MPILQLLDTVEDVDPNLADNDGNTPLIFAAQAGIHSIDRICQETLDIIIIIPARVCDLIPTL